MNNDKKSSWLDHPIFPSLPAFNVEILLFGLIILLAVVSRLYNLGERVISHDESLHTYFSWLLYKGSGYQHNPMMHGPLQFHLLALSYFLFGATDFTARLPQALAGVLTIAVLWNWRRYLGRLGTLVAAGLMLISPYMLYYSRYARNEVFVGLLGVLTLYAVLRYLETGKHRYLYLLTAATVLHFTAKETAFIYTAQALLFLAIYFIGRLTRKPWRSRPHYTGFVIALSAGVLLLGSVVGLTLYNKSHPTAIVSPETPLAIPTEPLSTLPAVPPVTLLAGLAALAFVAAGILLVAGYGWAGIRSERSFDMLMLLGTLVLPQLVAFPVKAIGWDPLNYNFTWPGWNFKAIFAQGMPRVAVFLIPVAILSVLLGLWWNVKLWLKNAALFYAIFTILYTTIFTYGDGFFSGMVGSLGYWLVQQGVNRGSQPWYYYILVQIPIYEFLPALGIWLAGVLALLHRRPLPLPGEAPSELEPALPLPADASPDPEPALPPSSDVSLAPDPAPSLDSSPGLVELGESMPEAAATQAAAPVPEGNPTFSLLLWWSLSSLLAFTIAGEKMPWLTFHITLPMILLTGWGLGQLIERTDWSEIRARRGLLVLALLVLFITSLFGAVVAASGATPPFQGKDLDGLRATVSFLLSLFVSVGSAAGLIYLLKDWNGRQMLRLGTLVSFGLLAVLTARAAFRAAYIEYDNGTEYLVYAHGARGIKDIMEQAEEISKRTTGGLDMLLAYDVSGVDTSVSWPFTWYVRDYTNTRPILEFSGSLRDAPFIIVDERNISKLLPIIGDGYYSFRYIRMVWPNQDYFGLNWARLKNMLTNREIRSGLFQIWLNRDYSLYAEATGSRAMTLANWEPSDRMQLFIRKDIAAQIWNYGIGPSAEVVTDPYEAGATTLYADLIVGTSGTAAGQFNAPRGIAVAPDGTIYVADSRNNRIQHFSADGQFINMWGTWSGPSPSTPPLDTLNEPWGVAVSPDGKWVYVTDTWNHRVIKFTPDGNPVLAWGYADFGQVIDETGFWGPRGIAVDAQGRVYVADTGNKRIVIFDADGNYLSVVGTFGFAGILPGLFDEPVGVAVDLQGNLYVADTWNKRVQSFAPVVSGNNFIPLLQWDITGWYGQSLDNKPFIAVSPYGGVFVTDPEMYRVLEFSPLGNFVRAWGTSGAGPSNIGLASGIAIDALGRVWVSDAANHRLMRFTPPLQQGGGILPTSPVVPSEEVSPSPSPELPAIPSSIVSPSPSPTPEPMETCQVTTGYSNGYLNLRTCAGINCPIIGWIPEGSLLTILQTGTTENWIEVQWGNLIGWVYSAYCPQQPAP